MDYPDQNDLVRSNVVIRDEPALTRAVIIMIGVELRNLMGMISTSASQRTLR